MNLEENIKTAIKKHALEENPKECCGVVISKNKKQEVIKCKNISENPEQHFVLNPSDYLKASRTGKILAIYHSHPNENETFSPYDISNSKSHHVDYILYNILKNSFCFFDYKKNKTFIYNKIFKSQTADCYSLVKEYFKKLNIKLLDKENSRTESNWQLTSPNLIEEIFNLNDEKNIFKFTKIKKCNAKKHDILCFQFLKNKNPDHVGVYLGDGTFLHHPRGKYPCIETLTQTYIKKINCIFRYEKFN